MSLQFRKISRTLLGFLIAGLFLYLAFRGTDLGELWRSLQSVNYFWVLVLIPIALASHWIRAVRWSPLLSPVKQNISNRNLFSAVMIGFMVNNLLPRVGELVRAYAIGRSEGISKTSALGTVIVERIIDLITFFFLFCAVLFFYPDSLEPFVDNVDAVRPFFLGGSILSIVLLVIVFVKIDKLFSLLKFFERIVPDRYRSRFTKLMEAFRTGFGVARMREKFAWIVFLSVIMWFLYALTLYVAFFTYNSLAGFTVDFGAAIILLTISSVAFILPAPGAMGTYHSFLTLAMVHLYHVDTVTALSYSIITHELGYFLTTFVGLFFFLKDHLKVSEVAHEATEGEAA